MKIAIRPIEPVAVITTTWRMVEPCVNFGAEAGAGAALMPARCQVCGRVSRARASRVEFVRLMFSAISTHSSSSR